MNMSKESLIANLKSNNEGLRGDLRKAQDKIAKLESDLVAADIVTSRLNGGEELQTLMRLNNTLIDHIDRLREVNAELLAALTTLLTQLDEACNSVLPTTSFQGARIKARAAIAKAAPSDDATPSI